jgi:hypothetical protein
VVLKWVSFHYRLVMDYVGPVSTNGSIERASLSEMCQLFRWGAPIEYCRLSATTSPRLTAALGRR